MKPKPTSPIQVLIVGAGPTGLATAGILAKLGVRVRVIDKNESRSEQSRALGVQAGTLECLANAFESTISDEMVKAGFPNRNAWVQFEELEPVHVDFSAIPSVYNYILILPQSETERFLENEAAKYSVRVERKTEMLAVVERGEKIYSTLRLPSGETEEVISDFVIGCDGAHSIVRNSLGIQFEGNPYTGDFILGDVKLEWKWPKDAVRMFNRKKGIIVCFPMRDDIYRIIMIPKFKTPPADTPEISLKEFQEILTDLSDGEITVTEATWLTYFRVHHRLAHHFKKGRMFIAGDAAHIHSPAGGQGMNTGIQDALNLGFKLARVLHGTANLSILEDYEKERLPVARKVVRGTDFVFKLALLPENPIMAWVRRNVLPKIIGSHFLQRKAVKLISEIAIAREEIRKY